MQSLCDFVYLPFSALKHFLKKPSPQRYHHKLLVAISVTNQQQAPHNQGRELGRQIITTSLSKPGFYKDVFEPKYALMTIFNYVLE